MTKINPELTSRAKPHPSVSDGAYSAYDERPGYPRASGQGYLFRNQAPAMSREGRQPRRYTREGDELPREMYHGTVADLRAGSAVEPAHASTRGEAGRTAMHAAKHGSGRHAYATADPAEAYKYAREAADNTGGEPRVYAVYVNARHAERDPEYIRNYRDRAGYQPDYHPSEQYAEDDDDAPFDRGGNFIAYRSRKPMRVTRDVTADAREAHAEAHGSYDDAF